MALAERDIAAPTSSNVYALRWTREEYYHLVKQGLFAGRRVELMEGEIITMPPMDFLHFKVVNSAGDVLKAAFGPGFFVTNQSPLRLGLASDPEPDFAVIAGSLSDYTEETGLPTGAALVVEASDSTLSYDRARKAAIYAEAGIADYWILNLPERRVEVRRVPKQMQNGQFEYTEIKVYERGDTLSPLAAPNKSILADDLLP